MIPSKILKISNTFGLRDDDIETIVVVLQGEDTVEQALIFGSRAKGNYRTGSDVDIALKGRNITHSTIVRISERLNEETLMPYRFDVLHYDTITHNPLVEHINRIGIVFYSKLDKKN